ncbi:Myb family transcription factor PHL8, partial [Mucuna pruriens]
MDLQNMQNQSMHFVLSTDSKPRLKWTPELHQRFIEATNQLGGADKATPKSLMRKYRLGKSQQLETCSDNNQEDYIEINSSDGHCSREISLGAQNQITENMQIAQALQMQMEVQRKLYEQIEVQKHLQLRIEAQGKYLQSVLKKAQEALAGYNSSPVGIELTKAELSQLVTIINNACPSSPISELTETRGVSLNCGDRKRDRGTMCSLESSLTSSESSGRKEEKRPMEEVGDLKSSNNVSHELPLMDIIHTEDKASNGGSSNETSGRKRSAATKSDDGSSVEQPCGKRCGNKLRKPKLSEMLDLNSQCQSDMDSKTLDLNCSNRQWHMTSDINTSVAQSFTSQEGVGNVRGRVLGGSSAINGGASEEFVCKAGWDKKLVKEAYEWVESKVVFPPYFLSAWQFVAEFSLLEAGILPYNGFSLEHIKGTKISGSVFDEFGKRHTSADLMNAGNPNNLLNNTDPMLIPYVRFNYLASENDMEECVKMTKL